MIKKAGAVGLLVLILWVVIDPEAAGRFTRSTLEDFVTYLRTIG